MVQHAALTPDRLMLNLLHAVDAVRDGRLSFQINEQSPLDRLAEAFDALDAHLAGGGALPTRWKSCAGQSSPKPPPDTSWLSMAEPKPPSLGEQPHSAQGCHNGGQPHLGPCIAPEEYARWYWTEGPGSMPVAESLIAKVTQRLVQEAFAAREQRQLRLQRADEYPVPGPMADDPHA